MNTHISVIIACRNEVEYIERCVFSMLDQQLYGDELEVVVADGMSDDGTREKIEYMAQGDVRIKTIENRDKIVSTALNNAVREARGNVIIRVDAHTEYARDYVRLCVETLERTGADNVGGPWRAKGKTYLQKAIALAFNSPYSSGGAASHKTNYEGPADSVYLGCWRKETLIRIGMFDEELVRNQDDELNLRLTRAGGKVWQSPKIRSWYYPRASLGALFKQYMQYGYWKVRVIQKHKLPASIRHLIPGLFVGGVIASALIAPFSKTAMVVSAGLLALYSLAVITASVLICKSPKNLKYLPVMPAVLAMFHFGYGYGFLRGMVDFVIRNKGANQTFTKITRGS